MFQGNIEHNRLASGAGHPLRVVQVDAKQTDRREGPVAGAGIALLLCH
jgi:hypothetical protein